MGFPRHAYWSGLLFSSSSGSSGSTSPALAGRFFTTAPRGQLSGERERESISFPGDSVYLSDETLAVLCSFLYPNRPGNATALEIVCLATLMPLATKSTGVALAGTSSNNQIIALSQENTGCTIRLHEVSRPHKSRRTESRLVVARDWERGIRSEGRRRGAEMEGEWQLSGRGFLLGVIKMS